MAIHYWGFSTWYYTNYKICKQTQWQKASCNFPREVFTVPHLLKCDTRHPFIMVISKDPWHTHCWALERGLDSNTQPSACEANALTDCATVAVPINWDVLLWYIVNYDTDMFGKGYKPVFIPITLGNSVRVYSNISKKFLQFPVSHYHRLTRGKNDNSA